MPLGGSLPPARADRRLLEEATRSERGVANAATWFTDEFPGWVNTHVLGNRIKLWRTPAAIAALILMLHAEEAKLG